jgi:hypothetical protein
MLSDTDAGKRDAGVEEGEIGEDADAAVEEVAEGSEEKTDLHDLAKARTCYRSILDDPGRFGCASVGWLL